MHSEKRHRAAAAHALRDNARVPILRSEAPSRRRGRVAARLGIIRDASRAFQSLAVLVAVTTPPSSTDARAFRRDVRVIGVVGVAHGMSHFFQLVLPPLFPMLRAEFGVSYATLGALVSTFYVASGFCQFGAGFAVDRFGARPVLLGGLGLLAGGTLLAGAVPGIAWLFPLAALMGIGNGVFHPADFAVLNANVNPRRLGHAYSSHGIGGSLGYALAPIASYGLAGIYGWRTALIVLGAAGLVALGLLATQRSVLQSRAHGTTPPKHTLANSIELFSQKPILLCFAYFCVLTVATIGVQTFVGTSLNAAYDIPLAVATSAITAYLLGNASGIFAGGFLAARTKRHDRVAATGLAVAALLMLLIAGSPVIAQWAIPMMALIGVAVGSTGPSRDMIVRGATPPGASGRVYGFVYSGLDLGATLGPVAMGTLLDHGSPRIVFAAVSVFLFMAIGTVIQVRRTARVDAASVQAAD
jgi:FSR family fosmidomycin resistance protein-like MFS transporter